MESALVLESSAPVQEMLDEEESSSNDDKQDEPMVSKFVHNPIQSGDHCTGSCISSQYG